MISLVKTYLKLLLRQTIYVHEYDLLVLGLVNMSKSHKIYEFLIKKYDKKINFIKNKQSSFIQGGIGGGIIHIYRKIELRNNNVFFEKTYSVKSREYKRNKYFYTHVYNKLQKLETKIVPPLKLIIKGEKLSIFYQEFVQLKTINSSEQFDLSIKYYNIYSSLNIIKKFTDIEYYHDFTKEPLYFSTKDIVMRQFKETSMYDEVCIFFNRVEEQIKHTGMLFQHGDLHIENIYKNNYLIDWDKSGFYPMGYDLGFIFAQRIQYLNLQNNVDKINEFIFSNAKIFVKKKDYFLLKYFTILFLTFKNEDYNIKPIFNDLMSNEVDILP